MLRVVVVSAKAVSSRRALVCGALLAALAGSVTNVAASKRVRQPTREDLATVWIGGGGGQSLEFFRLELDVRGTGVLTVQYLPDGPASAYRVRGTSLAGYAIRLEVEPIDPRSETLELAGEATSGLLRLDIRGRTPDWTRHIEFQRYDELLRRIRVVTEKAEVAATAR